MYMDTNAKTATHHSGKKTLRNNGRFGKPDSKTVI